MTINSSAHRDQGTLRAEVMEAEKRRCKATLEQDVNALRDILADDYIHVAGNGQWMGKQRYLDWVVELPRNHERGELTIRGYGDVAVITGELKNTLQMPDGDRSYLTYVTQVAHKLDGAWRFVSFHITPMQSVDDNQKR